jgi:carbamoyl-phosphate synthase large subunit
MKKTVTVAVSGINAIDNPGPGTGIIRALKESDMEIRSIGLAYDTMEPGIYMDTWVDKTYLLPYPSGSRESYLNRIAYIHHMEKIDVIIPALDVELPLYMDLKRDLEAMGIKVMLPSREMFKLRDKSRLRELADKIGVKCPEYKICTSFDDMFNAINQLGLPCMVKGPFYEAFKANTISEAESYFRKIANKWGYPIIIQEFVNGEEFDVVGCGDGKGNDIGLLAIKKMTTTSLGKVWNAVSIKNEKLLGKTANLVKELKWNGGFEFEVLMDPATQDIYLLEINPRFPAWIYMSAACGINLPERLVKCLMGMEYETHSNYNSGKLMIRYTAELVKDITDFESITTKAELENNSKNVS